MFDGNTEGRCVGGKPYIVRYGFQHIAGGDKQEVLTATNRIQALFISG